VRNEGRARVPLSLKADGIQWVERSTHRRCVERCALRREKEKGCPGVAHPAAWEDGERRDYPWQWRVFPGVAHPAAWKNESGCGSRVGGVDLSGCGPSGCVEGPQKACMAGS